MLYVGNTKYKIHIGSNSYKIAAPYDYEVLWLERNGNQYIDTRVGTSSNNIIEVQVLDFPSHAGSIVGSSVNASYHNHFISHDKNGNIRFCSCNAYSNAGSDVNVYVASTTGSDYILKLHGYLRAAYINNNRVGTFRQTSAGSSANSIFLFAINIGGTANNDSSLPLKIGKVRIWKDGWTNGNKGTLVRDFIPVVKNGIGYMFDKVEKKLYGNLGEGQFGIGPSKILPDNYKQVEYIESSGQQYIDLGFPISNTMNFYIKCQCLAAGFVFGCRTGPSSNVSGFNFDTTGSLIGIRMGQTILSGNIGWEVGKIYEVKIENRNCVMNGNVISTTAYGSNYYSGNCYLFACNNNGSLSNTIYNSNRIFRFKIYNNNATILDLIPCISPNNEVGMYDLGTGTFFGNNGSGVFTAGPEL